MLKKKFRLTGKDIRFITRKKNYVVTKDYLFYFFSQYSNRSFNQFSVVIPLKISKKASVRNFFKRRIYEFLQEKNLVEKKFLDKYWKIFIIPNKLNLKFFINLLNLEKKQWKEKIFENFEENWNNFEKKFENIALKFEKKEKNEKKLSAMSLIEVLIVIFIFSVGILSISNLLINSLKFSGISVERSQGTLLAKEGLDLVSNLKYSNQLKGIPRNCIPDMKIYTQNSNLTEDKICKSYFSSGAEIGYFYKISFDPEKYIFFQQVEKIPKNFYDLWKEFYLKPVNLNGNIVYIQNFDSSNQEFTGKFARYIRFEAIKEAGKNLPVDKIIKVDSVVLINSIKTGKIVLETFLGE